MLGERRMLKEFRRKDEGKKPLGRPRHGRMNGLAETLTLLTGIQGVLVSNPAGTLLILTAVFLSHSRKFLESILKWATTVSFHVTSNLLLTTAPSLDVIYSELMTARLNKLKIIKTWVE
jgi:hypothetical protein